MVVKAKIKSKSRSKPKLKSKLKPRSKPKSKVKSGSIHRSLKAHTKARSSTRPQLRKVGRPKKSAYEKKSGPHKITGIKRGINKKGVAESAPRAKSIVPARSLGNKPAFKAFDKYELRHSSTYKAAPSLANRAHTPLVDRRPASSRTPRIHQFTYMKAPGTENAFDVGDTVEVFCDHEKNRERIRGWVKGIVVQVDNKMVAVQFRSNVFLTDGWMVPDRILWYPLNSEHIRSMPGKKPVTRDILPEY